MVKTSKFYWIYVTKQFYRIPFYLQSPKPEVDEENEEEFLSPESESEHEEIEANQKQQASDITPKKHCKTNTPDNKEQIIEDIHKDVINESAAETLEETEKSIEPCTENESKNESFKDNETCPKSTPVLNEASNHEHLDDTSLEDINKDVNIDCKTVIREDNKDINIEDKQNINTSDKDIETHNDKEEEITDKEEEITDKKEEITDKDEEITDEEEKITDNINEEQKIENEKDQTVCVLEHNENNADNVEKNEEVSEAIEDPIMVVTGEGNGTDCDSYFLGEEISEAVMYFYGDGCGYDNDTGNPEAITEANDVKSEDENDGKELVIDNKDLVNGEHETNSTAKLKSVAKRSLKKQPNDSYDTNSDTKKPCMRDADDKSNSSKAAIDLKSETSVNDKSTTDSESPIKNKEVNDSKSPKKNNVKKRRSKVKKKAVSRKVNDVKKPINTENGNGQDKTSIIEKRKSSVSSVDEDLADISKENVDDPLAVEEPLPPKKLRLETTPNSDVNATHSKDISDAKEASDDKEPTSDANDSKDNLNDSISKRIKIKAHKGKFKRKKNKELVKNDKVMDGSKKGSKSLKRSLVEATMSDKNKSESQSESEDDEPVTSGKRLKIKPKKIITSTRYGNYLKIVLSKV